MKNVERAKDYQKKLYAALNQEWKEDLFDYNWLSRLYGLEWDKIYELGLFENDFCALCGNDELKSGYYRIPAFSNYRLQIPICDNCWNERGYEKVAQIQSKFKKKFSYGCLIIAVIIVLIFLSLII